MGVRCKECIFKSRDGSQEPCVNCNEIMDYKGQLKCKDNYFKPIAEHDKEKEDNIKNRLKKRLQELVPIHSRKFIRFDVEESISITLTAFIFNVNRKIEIYQLTQTEYKEDLIENNVILDRYVFEEVKFLLSDFNEGE